MIILKWVILHKSHICIFTYLLWPDQGEKNSDRLLFILFSLSLKADKWAPVVCTGILGGRCTAENKGTLCSV